MLAPLARVGVNDFRAKESKLAPARSFDATLLDQGEERENEVFLVDDGVLEPFVMTAPRGVNAGAADPPHADNAASLSLLGSRGRVDLRDDDDGRVGMESDGVDGDHGDDEVVEPSRLSCAYRLYSCCVEEGRNRMKEKSLENKIAKTILENRQNNGRRGGK